MLLQVTISVLAPAHCVADVLLQSCWVPPRLAGGHHMQRIAVTSLQPWLVHEFKTADNLAVLIRPCCRQCATSRHSHINDKHPHGMHVIRATMMQWCRIAR